MDAGLEKVVAAETVLSDVEGEAGRLIIRGLEVADLAREFDFEATAQHMWAGFFPGAPTAAALGKARIAAFEGTKRMQAGPSGVNARPGGFGAVGG